MKFCLLHVYAHHTSPCRSGTTAALPLLFYHLFLELVLASFSAHDVPVLYSLDPVCHCSTAAVLAIKPSLFSLDSDECLPHRDFPIRRVLEGSPFRFIMRVYYVLSVSSSLCSVFSIQIEMFSCKIIFLLLLF